MANVRVSLVRRCKTPTGWKFLPVAMSANGRLKANAVTDNGAEVIYPQGYYVLRHYEGRQLVWTRLRNAAGDDVSPSEAMAALTLAAKKAKVSRDATAAGVEIADENPERASISATIKRFVDAASARGAHEAAEVYQRSMDEFMETCKKTFVDELSHDDVVAFHKAMQSKKRSDRTIHNRHMHLRAFLLFAGIRGDDLKVVAGKKPRYEKQLVDIFEPAELDAFFGQAVKSDFDRLLFDVLLETGLREREAAHLEWADIKSERGVLKVESKPRWGHKVKDAEEREIPLSDVMVKRLKEYRKLHPGVSLVFGKDGDIPDGHLLRRLKTLVRNAGLNCGTCKGCKNKVKECERWYLHKFRATFITTLLRGGMDLRTVMTLSGHSDLASVERYIRPADKDGVRKLVNKIKFR